MSNQAGKGDKPRPVDKDQYNSNFEKINWSKNQNFVKNTFTKKGKTTYKY